MKSQKKIVLTTLGSTGDVRPFFALAKEIQRQGYAVLLGTHDLYATEAQAYSVPFVDLEPHYSEMQMRDCIQQLVAQNKPRRQLPLLMAFLLRHAQIRYQKILSEVLPGAQLLLCHHLDYPAQIAAAKLGIPRVHVFFAPGVLPFFQDDLCAGLLGPSMGAHVTNWVWQQIGRCLDNAFKRHVPPELRQLHDLALASVQPGFAALSPHLNLVCVSDALVNPPTHMPAHVKCVAPWVFEHQPPQVLTQDEKVLEFIARCPKAPHLVNFGSMATTYDNALVTRLTQWCLERSTPLILQTPSVSLGTALKEQEEHRSSGFLFRAQTLSHSRILKHCQAVWHHCGAGTTYAVCRAGVPSVCVPHLADQFFWARRLQKLGCSPSVTFSRSEVSFQNLSQIVHAFESDPCYHRDARELADRMRGENGVVQTVSIVEQIL